MSSDSSVFEELLARQQAGFAAGHPIDLRQAIPAGGVYDDQQWWTLLERDLRYRLEAGLSVAVDEYVEAFPEHVERLRAFLAGAAPLSSASAGEKTTATVGLPLPEGSSVGSSSGAGGSRPALPGPLKQLQPGTAFGFYDLISILGKGGTGAVVYRSALERAQARSSTRLSRRNALASGPSSSGAGTAGKSAGSPPVTV